MGIDHLAQQNLFVRLTVVNLVKRMRDDKALWSILLFQPSL